ncbi:ribose-phosphate pyrophosphokinase [Candidatus Nomurabacteria bacterium]|nr:ribose-phosphate pyrophosphokinase [Candidatus Nomurabacteria bacterium]
MIVFGGSSVPELTRGICDKLEIEPGRLKLGRFSDGEIHVEIDQTVRGRDVCVVQSTCAPANDHLMELLIMIDALKRASAGTINAVIPYFGYARQDRKATPRAPISARLMCDLLRAAGVHRILTMEVHARQITGFFDGPFDHLLSSPVLLPVIRNWLQEHTPASVASPDAGGVERARNFAYKLDNLPLAVVDKRRSAPNVSEVMNLIGEVHGRHILLIDDMIDTAGSICSAAKIIMEMGALSVSVAIVHGVFSGPAIDRIAESPIDQVLVTNTIPLSPKARACPKIKVVNASWFFAKAIKAICSNGAVSLDQVNNAT